MNTLRKWALASTAATYLLIFVGGLVRVSGAGLGCPDWPRCFGRWVPPTSVDQLPLDIDPATFNVTLAWIEYINRLIGVSIGLLITITAVLALLKARGHRSVLYPILAAWVLVGIEGWQGSIVVGSLLAPLVVSAHMLLAFLIVSLLLYATLRLYQITGRGGQADASPGATRHPYRGWLTVLWILSIVEITIGTQVRSALEVLIELYPLLSDGELFSLIGWTDDLHMILGGVVVIATWLTGMRLLRQPPVGSFLVPSVWLLMSLALAQVALGLVLLAVDLGPLLQLFHLWLSCFYVGVLLTVHYALRQGGTADVRYAA